MLQVQERVGRPAATSRVELERIGLELFIDRGFEATTVDDIAAAAGVSRRTFFRYFASKNDVVWGDFDALLDAMDGWLGARPARRAMMPTLADAVIRFNSLAPEAVASHRQRMSLILHVPALQAHSTLRYAEWRAVVARFAARQLDVPERSMQPQLVGHVTLAAAVTAYEQWLADPHARLDDCLAAALSRVRFRFVR